MQSQHVDFFNHDPWAAGYDEHVRNEADPIRTGYEAVLDWTVTNAQIGPAAVVVDLGMGTGNTAQRIVAAKEVIGVDISTNMLALAKAKLAHLPVRFVQADLLAFFNESDLHYDALVSTYAVHHLTEAEKTTLFAQIWRTLRPGGRAVFGDLMFANQLACAQLQAYYSSRGDTEMVETFAEEFFWFVDSATAVLQDIGFTLIEVQQFSTLSWGICVEKPTDPA